MRWTFDTDARAFYFYLSQGMGDRQQVGLASIFDVDVTGSVVGVEVLLPVEIRKLQTDLLGLDVRNEDASRILQVILQMSPHGVTFSNEPLGEHVPNVVARSSTEAYLVPA